MKENPYAPPSSKLETDQPGKEIVLASRWKRFCAATIDGIISMIIILPVMYFTGGFSSISEGQQNSLLYSTSIGLFGLIIFILLHGKLLVKYGQTVGKSILKIKIADLNGNLPTLKRHILPRYAFTTLVPYIPVLGGFISLIDFLFIFGKPRRCIHDYIGKTIVIKS